MLSRRLRVAILFSARPHGVADLLARDPNRGVLYDVVAAATTEEPFPERRALWEAHGVPLVSKPIRRFHRWLGASLRDMDARAAYDETLAMGLEPYRPDVLILAGYLYVLTRPILDRFHSRIINVHHGDLVRRTADGGPRFPGLRAVRDAIFAGEAETRATAHLVTEELDGGPLVGRSWAFPVSPLVRYALEAGATDAVKAYAFAHQEWMLGTAWTPLLARSIGWLATGEVAVVGGRALVAGRPGPMDVLPHEGLLPSGEPTAPALAEAHMACEAMA